MKTYKDFDKEMIYLSLQIPPQSPNNYSHNFPYSLGFYLLSVIKIRENQVRGELNGILSVS